MHEREIVTLFRATESREGEKKRKKIKRLFRWIKWRIERGEGEVGEISLKSCRKTGRHETRIFAPLS